MRGGFLFPKEGTQSRERDVCRGGKDLSGHETKKGAMFNPKQDEVNTESAHFQASVAPMRYEIWCMPPGLIGRRSG